MESKINIDLYGFLSDDDYRIAGDLASTLHVHGMHSADSPTVKVRFDYEGERFLLVSNYCIVWDLDDEIRYWREPQLKQYKLLFLVFTQHSEEIEHLLTNSKFLKDRIVRLKRKTILC